MTTITLSHISKRFTSDDGTATVALNDISLKAQPGEVIAILGPSGCGKSTLLRIIAGLMSPDSGSVLYDNVPLDDVPHRERGIGMVFQEGALMPHWVAEKSVGFFLRLRQREHEIPPRVKRISEITGIGLDKLLVRKPSQLSGGERQRVAVARALARDPRVFLFDEPFSSIDAALRTHARVELKRLLHEFPVTSFYVTHDQHEAIAMANRIAVMRTGHIEQFNDYLSLYNNPINIFVATFIGVPTINLFKGRVRGHRWQGTSFGDYPIRSDISDDTPVIAGIRPEQFDLFVEDGVAVRVVEVIDYYAERMQVAEVVSDYDRWQLVLPLDTQAKAGDVIRCRPKADALLYFDPITGQRIG